MTAQEYNCEGFSAEGEAHLGKRFPDLVLHAGRPAPDFVFEDLETGQSVHLTDLWSGGLVILEFGSYT